ncbi:hypothetical protein HDU90_008590 [Geranomyces variabilis]|nr:hypothetical protein HDU90_008590 [Geranomyces variabilis]
MPVGSVPRLPPVVEARMRFEWTAALETRIASLEASGIAAAEKISEMAEELERTRGHLHAELAKAVEAALESSSGGLSRHPEVYVDNRKNRALGRVGMPRGSQPAPRLYYKNSPRNRQLKRVGMPYGWTAE